VIAEHALPSASTYHELISSHEVIMPGDMRVGEAFVVEDVVTAKIVFRELDPAPDAPGTANGTVRFALPADKSVVAVGYGFPRSNQPVTVYDTRDWRKLATLVVPAEGPTGVGRMKLSNDHALLAYASSRGLIVVDAHTGKVLTRLPVNSADFTFSPNGHLLAVAEIMLSADKTRYESSGLHIFRLTDRAEVASFKPAGSPYNLHWDPHGRFLAFMIDGNAVHFWNPSAEATEDRTIQLRSVSRSFALSPDGKRMAVGDGDAIDVFKIGD
jgi:WD40 repeat protein